MKQTLLVWMMLCAALAAAALPEWKLIRAKEAMVLDGKADEATWRQAPWAEGFTRLGPGAEPAAEPTRFKMLRDDGGIWMFWDCRDAAVKSEPRQHDDAVWHDDCVEVFFSTAPDVSPDHNIREYYQIIVNPDGAVYDTFSRGGSSDGKWDSLAKAAGRRVNGGWQLELYIPFAAFPDCHPDEWRFLCGRENYNGSQAERSAFPASLKFQELDSYARLTGLGLEGNRFRNSLAALDIATEMDGEAVRCQLVGAVRTALTGKVSLHCRVLDAGRRQVDFVGDLFEVKDGAVAFRLPVKIAGSGLYRCQLFLRDGRGLVWTGRAERPVEVAPCTVETLWPFHRDAVLSAMADKTARFRITPRVGAEMLKACRIEAEARHEDGAVLAPRRVLSPADCAEWKVPLAGVKPGRVKVAVTMSRGGKVLGRLEKEVRVVAPQGGNEVWIDAERRLVLNGKPYYMRGFYGVHEDAFALLAASGCNTVHSYTVNMREIPGIVAYLDQAHANGLKVVMRPFHRIRQEDKGFLLQGRRHASFDRELQERTLALIKAVGKHPALLGWYLYDEPRGPESVRNLKAVYEFLREHDPWHLVMGCDNSGAGCISKKGHCDVHWPDIYPSPLANPRDYFSIPIVALANQLRAVVEQVGREAVCYVPMAFERNSFAKYRGNHRAMTCHELRASVFAGVTAGVRGMMPYKLGDPAVKYGETVPNSGIFSDPNMRLGYLKGIMPELRALEAALLSPRARVQAAVSNQDVRQITLDCGGANYVFLVNVTQKKLGEVAIAWPGGDAAKVRLLGGNGRPRIQGAKVLLDFGSLDSFVLTDDPNAPSTVDFPALQAEIDAAWKR